MLARERPPAPRHTESFIPWSLLSPKGGPFGARALYGNFAQNLRGACGMKFAVRGLRKLAAFLQGPAPATQERRAPESRGWFPETGSRI